MASAESPGDLTATAQAARPHLALSATRRKENIAAGDSRSLRRTKSFQKPRPCTDSSDSMTSDNDSIYNAVIVSSDERLDELDAPSFGTSRPASTTVSIRQSSSLESLARAAHVPSQPKRQTSPNRENGSCSNWPSVPLETITEQTSLSTGHASSSRSNQVVGIERAPNPRSNNSQGSPPLLTSQGPRARLWRRSRPFHQSHRRCFSETAASCMTFSPPQKKLHKKRKSRAPLSSSSSNSDLLPSQVHLAFPLEPSNPPPERPPTPPGLPSFGTEEAIRLFNPPHPHAAPSSAQKAPPHNMAGARCRQAHRGDLNATRSQATTGASANSVRQPPPGSSDSVSNQKPPPPESRLRHLFNLFSPPRSRERLASRGAVALPAGFVARADDGTIVRGRFGARCSGHGVGAQSPHWVGLEGHPFHRTDLPVRETGGGDGVGDASPTLADPGANEAERMGVSVNMGPAPRDEAIRGATVAGPSGTQPPPSVTVSGGRGGEGERYAMCNLEGPGSLPPPPLPPANTPHEAAVRRAAAVRHDGDDVAGLREFIEQGERQRREMVGRHRARDGNDDEVDLSCWSFCCAWARGGSLRTRSGVDGGGRRRRGEAGQGAVILEPDIGGR